MVAYFRNDPDRVAGGAFLGVSRDANRYATFKSDSSIVLTGQRQCESAGSGRGAEWTT